MANPTVRSFPIFYKSKKIGTANDCSITQRTGRQAMFGAEGYLTHSKGAVQTTVTVKYVVPVAGLGLSIIEDCLAQNDVEIGIPVAGKIEKVTMAITENMLQSNTETGRAEGTLTLEGGAPQLT